MLVVNVRGNKRATIRLLKSKKINNKNFNIVYTFDLLSFMLLNLIFFRNVKSFICLTILVDYRFSRNNKNNNNS